MLVSVLGFGSIWTRRIPAEARVEKRFDPRELAYYNTTGVEVRGKIRNRSRVYGVARFNGNSGFHPECWHRMLYKVFDCEPPCTWNGHKKVLFKTLLPGPEKPDAYLVVAKSEQTGGIIKRGDWLHSETTLISFSECGADQEVMAVMPAYSWVRGVLGTFFLEPVAARPWEARLVLSAAK
jgi:hypothetical protein